MRLATFAAADGNERPGALISDSVIDAGETISIEITGLGRLVNPVVPGK